MIKHPSRNKNRLLRDGCLITPELTRCGVAGVQRDRVLAYAQQHDVAVQIRDVLLAEAYLADELLLVNSVIGVWSVRELGERHWQDHSFATRLRTELTQGELR